MRQSGGRGRSQKSPRFSGLHPPDGKGWSAMADTKAKPLSQRRQNANLPVRATTAELAKMGRLTYLSAEKTQAKNPQTGEMGDGFLVIAQDSDGRKFQAF